MRPYRMQMPDYAGCIEDNTHAIMIDPTNSDAYGNRGMTRCFMKQYAEAMNPEVYRIRARIYVRLKNTAASTADIETAAHLEQQEGKQPQ